VGPSQISEPPSQSQMKFSSLPIRGPLLREFLIFLAFFALTALMTWPWVLQLRDAVPDPGDPYAISYFLWWDYHQTFHDPLHLFHATVFYPYRYTLAFGEFDYGVSLIFFPLFALGIRPLTVYGLAAFLSFPFTGYGAFRLGRTLSGSTAIGWITGIVLAFVPFRFHHLAHLHLIFAGWIPLLFEALVLFARTRSWLRAGWLGFAFLMNGLTCFTWLILSAIPLGFSAALLLTRNNAWRDRDFWVRAGITLCAGSLLLLPFLLPLRRVSALYGFVRTTDEVMHYSARPINWLAADERNKVWRGFGAAGNDTEMVLFPGLLAPLLGLAAFLLPKPKTPHLNDDLEARSSKWILRMLDATAIISGILAIMAIGYDVFKLRLFGHTILTARDPDRALFILALALIVRCSISYPRVLRVCMSGDKNLSETVRSPVRSELFAHALVWSLIGFLGSFGLNLFFHKFLYDYIYIFRGMRVVTRWAMICYVGLALLAGLGAARSARVIRRWLPRFGKTLTYGVIIVAILLELHVAPLKMLRGEIDPDALTLYLKARKMSGGIVELPAGDRDHLYMLRAADHGHPLVNGSYSFVPPLTREIEELNASQPIPDRLLDIFETIPVSYVTVHRPFLSPESRAALEIFLIRGVAAGRLRFIKSFEASNREGAEHSNDLYAVIKTEPEAHSEVAVLPSVSAETLESLFPGLLEESSHSAGLIFRYYKASFGRLPRFDEFVSDLEAVKRIAGPGRIDEASSRAFGEAWVNRRGFISKYAGLSDEQYVSALFSQAALDETGSQRVRLLQQLQDKTITRAAVLQQVVADPIFATKEIKPAFVLLLYFSYLHRDPDLEGYQFWLSNLDRSSDYGGLTRAFANAIERQLKSN
jgi:hypothetical protein